MTKSEKTLKIEVDKIAQERDLWMKKFQQSEEAYALLVSQIKEMRRHIFGSRSERYVDPENPQQPLDWDASDDVDSVFDLVV